MNPKIVRDLIPDIISASGRTPVYDVVPTEEAIKGLEDKLSEELNEYLADHSLEELADLLEVMHGILYHKGISWEQLEQVRLQKREERGGFEQRLFLTDILSPEEPGL